MEVSALKVLDGSRQVQAPTSLTGPAEVSFSAGDTVYLHYRLSGALQRSGTRALATAISLSLGESATGAQTIDFVDATLLSLACAPASGAGTTVSCGADAGSKGWEVVAPADLDAVRVMAQIDLAS